MNRAIILLLIATLLVGGCSSSDETSEAEATPLTATPAAATLVAAAGIAATDVAMATEQAEYPTPTENLIPIDEVIEYEMKASFDFFWDQTNSDDGSAGYGLVRDRYPGSEGVASMAAVGFGLTAYPIGVEKGYITHEEGFERANGTMDTLLAMDRVEGFYFHFVDMASGERVWQSELSNIDTAILLMGVLTAGEYFGGEVESKAQQIYDGVNWPWFVDESRQMFHMAYRPEEGFAGHWDFYAEQLMLYVLAAGSDTYPLDDTTYYTFIRHYAAYGEGEPFIHSWFGSIFTYQFSHAWLDFRDYTDGEGANWFDNSVEASRAHYQFAVDNEDAYNTIGRHAWGLTASDGPEGYNGLYGAPPSGFDNRAHFIDDTVAPAGAIGSIIFLPEEAEQAMLNYYAIEPLNGEYGFLDAYNLSEDWFAGDVIGIDKGITLLMLANYQNDLVYDIVMQNEQLLNGLARLQITKSE